MAKQIRTHLIVDGTSEETMNFYIDLFPKSEVHDATHYDEGKNNGKLQQASVSLGGREFIYIEA